MHVSTLISLKPVLDYIKIALLKIFDFEVDTNIYDKELTQ